MLELFVDLGGLRPRVPRDQDFSRRACQGFPLARGAHMRGIGSTVPGRP